jgi:hypothetical protein
MGLLKTLTINGTTYDVVSVVPAASITLRANAWVGSGTSYSQVVAVPGITPHTKIDLQPSLEQLEEFHYKTLAFVAENDNCVVTVYSVGDKPTGDHTIQITKTEVEGTGPIRGNTVGTTMPRPDWNQDDPEKADYIRNKPYVPTFDDNTVGDNVWTSQKVASEIKNGSPAIVCEASGEVITLTDASDRPLQGLTLYGKTTQNGTPTPEAPVALESAGASGSIGVTVTGKNLFDKDNYTRMNAYISEGVITAYSSAARTVFYIPCAPNTTYTVSRVAVYAGERLGLGWTEDVPKVGSYVNNEKTPTMDATVGSVISRTLTTGATAKYLVCYLGWTSRTDEAATCQIEVGSVATAYEPYKGQILSVSTPNGLPGVPQTNSNYYATYTDSNGQRWVCDEIDFERGVYVQRIVEKVLGGTESWKSSGGNVPYFTSGLGEYGSVIGGAALATHLQYQAINSSSSNIGITVGSSSAQNRAQVQVRISTDITTVTACTEWFKANPTTILYALAEPIETPLSAEELAAYAALHSNKPNTTVYNDSGVHMDVAYVADTKTYIDNKLAQISAAMLNA